MSGARTALERTDDQPTAHARDGAVAPRERGGLELPAFHAAVRKPQRLRGRLPTSAFLAERGPLVGPAFHDVAGIVIRPRADPSFVAPDRGPLSGQPRRGRAYCCGSGD